MFVLATGFLIGKEIDRQDKDVKEASKSVLIKFEQGAKSINSIVSFPYPVGADGKKLAEGVAKTLNSAEEAYRQAEKDKVPGGGAIVLHMLDLLDFQVTISKTHLLLKNRLPEAGYMIVWHEGKWVVRELSKKKP